MTKWMADWFPTVLLLGGIVCGWLLRSEFDRQPMTQPSEGQPPTSGREAER